MWDGASADAGIVVRMWSGFTDVAPRPPRHVCISLILKVAFTNTMLDSLKNRELRGCSTATKAPRVIASDTNHDLNIT